MNSTVVVQKTLPERVVGDYGLVLNKFWSGLRKQPVIIKLNLSWTKFYPACSSPPWQVEGVIKGLLDLGFSPKQIIPVENRTVVTDVCQGARNHFWDKICKKYGVRIHFLTKEKYVEYKPKAEMLVLNKIFPQGIFLPEILFNKPLISLCTLKTHVFTKTTGAIKNYFGMLNTKRHWAHRFIHEAIIDLLQIQKEIHPRILALMDGAVVGFGAGPRAMHWKKAGLILASQDEVAIDAAASSIIGFSPLKIKYLLLGNQLGLGENDIDKIKVIGVKRLPNFHLAQDDTFASVGQKMIYHHLPWWLEKLLLQTFIAPWSYLASRLYYDVYWYNLIGRKRVRKFLNTEWGRLFRQYEKD
jgi:uncharacterized protein (DUF362 family)